MNVTKISVGIGVATGLIVLLGYLFDVVNYYLPRAEAQEQHQTMQGYSELERIKTQLQLIEIQIDRITDRAEIEDRELTLSEQNDIASLRIEQQLLNDRKLELLGQKK